MELETPKPKGLFFFRYYLISMYPNANWERDGKKCNQTGIMKVTKLISHAAHTARKVLIVHLLLYGLFSCIQINKNPNWILRIPGAGERAGESSWHRQIRNTSEADAINCQIYLHKPPFRLRIVHWTIKMKFNFFAFWFFFAIIAEIFSTPFTFIS